MSNDKSPGREGTFQDQTECPACGKTFATREDFVRHNAESHVGKEGRM